jgi:hypothetical protein
MQLKTNVKSHDFILAHLTSNIEKLEFEFATLSIWMSLSIPLLHLKDFFPES